MFITKVFSRNSPGRVGKFQRMAKYLSQRGWKITFVTPTEPGYKASYELLKGVKAVNVCKTNALFNNPRRFYYKEFYDSSEKAPHQRTILLDRFSKALSIGLNFLKTWSSVPDAWIGWLPFALAGIRKVLANEDIDIIYTASYPYTSHIIGLITSALYDKPWIVSFRDPWFNNPLIQRPTMLDWLAARMERKVLRSSDKIFIYKGWFPNGIQYFENRYPDLADKVVELPYVGYDQNDFPNIVDSKPESFRITYAGNFYGGDYSPTNFLVAISELLNEDCLPKEQLEVVFIGNLQKRFQELIDELKLREVINYVGRIPYDQVIPYLLNSAVSLWVMGQDASYQGNIPSKVFDYIGAGRPILAVVPEGESAEFIRRYNLGLVASPSNIERIKQCVMKFHQLYKENNLRISKTAREKFSFEETMSKMSQELLNLLRNRK